MPAILSLFRDLKRKNFYGSGQLSLMNCLLVLRAPNPFLPGNTDTFFATVPILTLQQQQRIRTRDARNNSLWMEMLNLKREVLQLKRICDALQTIEFIKKNNKGHDS